jgi:hypothetical protein
MTAVRRVARDGFSEGGGDGGSHLLVLNPGASEADKKTVL